MPTGQDDPSPWLPGLLDAPSACTLEVTGDSEPDFLALPARPGVAVFEDGTGRTLVVATTADLRELARRRLGGGGPGDRAVVRRVVAVEAGSSLEADLIYLAEARRRMPETHKIVSERWRAWFVHVDPAAEFPEWTKTCLSGAVKARSAAKGVGMGGQGEETRRGVLLGPLPDKDAAGRFIGLVIDAFDLCREHHLLRQAPAARACPYKEMGRCAAPCDGSEPLESYRARTRRAAEIVDSGLERVRGLLEEDMKRAAAGERFEEAGALSQQVKRLAALAAPAFAHVQSATRLRMVFVTPGARAGRARVMLLAGGRMGVVGEVAVDPGAEEAHALAARAVEAGERAAGLSGTPEELDTLAAATRWLYSPAKRRRGGAIRVTAGMGVEELAEQVRGAARLLKKEKPTEIVDQVVEA